MISKIIYTILIIFTTISFTIAADRNFTKPIIVKNGGFQYIDISLETNNRISCPDDIGFVNYSKEKNIHILRKGKNAFIKVLPVKGMNPNGSTFLSYQTFQRELFLECGGTVFSFIMVPKKKIPAQTILLKPEYLKIEQAAKYEKASDYKSVIVSTITDYLYKDLIPPGYKKSLSKLPVQEFTELTLTPAYTYTGAKYRYDVIKLIGKETTDIHEGMFISIVKKPLAATLTNLHIKKDMEVLLFITSLMEANR